MSRVGKKSIQLPEKVTIKVADSTVEVEGPKGKLSWDLPQGITLNEDDGAYAVGRTDDSRHLRSMHGTSRALIANMVEGVSSGFVKNLEIHGVGFRAAVKGSNLDLSLGFSHPVLHPIPESLTVSVADNTKITIEGIDKHTVGQFASDVRSYYPPEPYKGKGVRYADEHVRRKQGKSVQ